jgi:methylmalonyl-CoA epimerase
MQMAVFITFVLKYLKTQTNRKMLFLADNIFFIRKVNDINEAMKTCKENKIRCLSNEPRIGAHGKPVVFLHPKDCCGTLVELEQE